MVRLIEFSLCNAAVAAVALAIVVTSAAAETAHLATDGLQTGRSVATASLSGPATVEPAARGQDAVVLPFGALVAGGIGTTRAMAHLGAIPIAQARPTGTTAVIEPPRLPPSASRSVQLSL